MGSLLWNKFTFALVVAALGIIAFDVQKQGSFKGSQTYKYLKESGALDYGQLAWTKFRTNSQLAYRWSQKNVPVYLAQAREALVPFLVTVRDVVFSLAKQLWTNVKLLQQYLVDKRPLAAKWINNYAPGLLDKLSEWFRQLRQYASQLAALVLKYLSLVGQWLRDNVFTGSLSPENLQKYTMDAFNSTRSLALQTVSWIQNKMEPVPSRSRV